MASLLLPLPIIHSCRVKLWHLWLGIPGHYLSLEILATLPLWFFLPNTCVHWPQELDIFPSSPKTEQMPSQMAPQLGWLWPENCSCFQKTSCWTGCTILWFRSASRRLRQFRNSPPPWFPLCQPHQHCLSLLHFLSVLHQFVELVLLKQQFQYQSVRIWYSSNMSTCICLGPD